MMGAIMTHGRTAYWILLLVPLFINCIHGTRNTSGIVFGVYLDTIKSWALSLPTNRDSYGCTTLSPIEFPTASIFVAFEKKISVSYPLY